MTKVMGLCSHITRMKKTILITGAGGFLGKELLKRFENGAYPEATDVFASTSAAESLKAQFTDPRIHFIGRDALTNLQTFPKVDCVVNCAFPRNTDGVDMAKGLQYLNSVIGNAWNAGVKEFINISSQSVYSPVRTSPAEENTIVDLDGKYAVGKYAVELMVNGVFRSIPHTNLRMASLVGPQFPQRVVNKMIKNAIGSHEIGVISSASRFGYMDIRDAADGIFRVLQYDGALDEVYNLGTNRSYTLEEIAEEIRVWHERVFGMPLKVNKIEKAVAEQNSTLCCRKMEDVFSFRAERTMKDIVEEIGASVVTQMISPS